MEDRGETSSPRTPKTRSQTKDLDPDKDFPPCKYFQPPTKLPTVQSVIGMLRYHLEMVGIGKVTTDMAVQEVAKQVYTKYYHDTVFCVSLTTIHRRVKALRKQFSEGKKGMGRKERRTPRLSRNTNSYLIGRVNSLTFMQRILSGRNVWKKNGELA